MDDQTKRFFLVMREKNMNATQFSKEIGINNAIISQIKRGRNAASGRVLARIINRFSDINPEWLMTGKGTMKIESIQPGGLFEDYQQDADPTDQSGHEDTNYTNEPDFDENELPPQKENFLKYDENKLAKKDKIVNKEVIIYKESPVKAIEKLVIFYSDRTYESFIPEKQV